MKLQPLLRWAGGKRWLANYIDNLLPEKINSYYEPFCGSCAVFYSIQNKIDKNNVYLSDANQELINFYQVLQKQPTRLINYLKQYENTEEFYYSLRGKQVNSYIEKASIFYYLNRTSFNGIYRVNLKGIYNVPFGHKTYETLFNEDQIYLHSEILKGVTFQCADFSWLIPIIKENDFVFLDPPYTVSHNNNGFIKYNKNLFSLKDQYRLKETIDKISARKAHFLLTNAHHETISEIFSKNSYAKEINRYTSISGTNSGRKNTMEYIFSNYEVNYD